MTVEGAIKNLKKKLEHLYPDDEALAIAKMAVGETCHIPKWQLALQGKTALSEAAVAELQAIEAALMQAQPVQYVLKKTWFYGDEWKVNPHVLIPRPETEELVQRVLSDMNHHKDNLPHPLVCDIGTGSGCIAISIKKNFPQADVYAIDVSEDALNVAMENATNLKAAVNFVQLNFLDASKWMALARFHYIVSNPPYVLRTEMTSMHANVLQFEPHLALFVEDDDPLLFYRAIAIFGEQHLKPGGKIFVEVNAAYGRQTAELFASHAYKEVAVLQDMQGRDRFVTATLG